MQNLKEKTDLWFRKWHEEYGKYLPEHSKVSKLGLWWDSFIQSRKGMSLKFTEELCIMTMKNGVIFEVELMCRFKIETTIWRMLTQALKCLKNFHLNELLLTKGYNVWIKKSRRVDTKFWKNTGLCSSIFHEEFGKFSEAKK